jgi:transcriptional regulator with XRE-family HTH domain
VDSTRPGAAETARRNLARQRELYGEVLGDRVRRLVLAFDVSQAQLACVVGISPTMLSQVVNGRRQKIANPAVLARMTLLERRASGAAVGGRAALLEEVRATSVPEAVAQAGEADPALVVAALRAELTGADLQACAEAVRAISPSLAGLLEQAAR